MHVEPRITAPETIAETTTTPCRIWTAICAVALAVFICKSLQIEFEMQRRSGLQETDRKIRYRNSIFLTMAMTTAVVALAFFDRKNNAG